MPRDETQTRCRKAHLPFARREKRGGSWLLAFLSLFSLFRGNPLQPAESRESSAIIRRQYSASGKRVNNQNSWFFIYIQRCVRGPFERLKRWDSNGKWSFDFQNRERLFR